MPPGACIREIAPSVVCDFGDSEQPPALLCSGAEFRVPDPGNPGFGTCHVDDGPCTGNADCTMMGAVCLDGAEDLAAIAAPFSEQGDGSRGFVSAGVCRDAGGVQDGTCETGADCAMGFTCEPELTQAGAADVDGDLDADPIDNCPTVPNPDQADADDDGIGDACDRQTCGDGSQTYAEQCDDGNQANGDGCDDACQLEAGFETACSNGLDDDATVSPTSPATRAAPAAPTPASARRRSLATMESRTISTG